MKSDFSYVFIFFLEPLTKYCYYLPRQKLLMTKGLHFLLLTYTDKFECQQIPF